MTGTAHTYSDDEEGQRIPPLLPCLPPLWRRSSCLECGIHSDHPSLLDGRGLQVVEDE